jgi:hypothetical protein
MLSVFAYYHYFRLPPDIDSLPLMLSSSPAITRHADAILSSLRFHFRCFAMPLLLRYFFIYSPRFRLSFFSFHSPIPPFHSSTLILPFRIFVYATPLTLSFD